MSTKKSSLYYLRYSLLVTITGVKDKTIVTAKLLPHETPGKSSNRNFPAIIIAVVSEAVLLRGCVELKL